MKPALSLLVSLALLSQLNSASAQIFLNGGGYTETFDNLGAGLPTGWLVVTGATATTLGIPVTFSTSAVSWGSSSGAFGNYAATTNADGTAFVGQESVATQAACGNRCLGVRQTGAFGDPGAAFLLQLQDTLGFASFELGLDLDQLSAQGRSTIWSIQYALGNTPTSFVTVATFTDPVAFGSVRKTIPFDHALDNQNQTVWLRIAALTSSTGSGSRDTFGLDNCVLTYSQYVENTDPPEIAVQPPGQTNRATTTAVFATAARGAAPFAYQWRKDGVDLSDGGNVLGARTPTLTLTNVLAADAAAYSVVVSNAYGVAVSSNALLIVIDPIMTLQPLSRTNLAGDTATFAAAAVGTLPLAYQWRFNGSDVAGATASSLVLKNVEAAQQGAYVVVISNASSAVTSAPALLTVLATPSVRLAGWDFNAADTSTNAPIASFGVGNASLLGGVRSTLSGGSPADPAGSGNTGWNTTGYPTASTNNLTAGVQFNVNTRGYQNIWLTWEERHSDTASKYLRFQYSGNGVWFTNGPVIVMNATNNSYVFFSADLSEFTDANDNPDFAFRLVTEWEASAIGGVRSNYVATTSTYSAGGTIRLDLVNVFGEPLGTVMPIPLHARLAGDQLVLTWSNPAFRLQSAPEARGEFSFVPGATSPYTHRITANNEFFRLQYSP